MARIGKCCLEPEQCLCNQAWDLTTWSFSVFGKSYSGSWLPSTPDTETCVRSGEDCDYDDPDLVVDTLEDSGWVDRAVPNLSALCLCAGCGGHSGQKAVSWQRSEAYSSRVAVWHHIQTYVSITAVACSDSQVKFVVNAIYSVTRIVQAIDRSSNRYKKVERDCDAGTQTTVGDWEYICGDVDDYIVALPQLPCEWPQLTGVDACVVADNPTTPSCSASLPAFTTREVTTLECVSGVCTPVVTINDTFACSGGSLDGGCGCTQPFQTCIFGVSIDATTGARAQRRQYAVTWESDCYSCDSIPSTVTLERTDSVPTIALTGDVTVNVFDSATGSGCGTAPAVSITIPFALSVSVS